MNSKLFSLNWQDVAKAVLLFFLAAFLTSLVQILESGAFPTLTQLKSAAVVALTTSMSYLIKNFITNSEGQIGKQP